MTSYLLINGLQLLLDVAAKSLIVMLAAWALTAALRRASAATRHWVWSAALVGLLALPALSLMLPGWRIELLPALANNAGDSSLAPERQAETPLSAASPAAAIDSSKQVSASSQSSASKVELDPVPQAPLRSLDAMWPAPIPSLLRAVEWLKTFNWATAAMMFWGMGALLVMARLLAGTLRIRRLAKSASVVRQSSWLALAQSLAARLRLRSNVELRKSEQVSLPMTWGALRSVVMLPAEADEWPEDCRSIVLLHELAHIKRRDCLTQMLAQVTLALYWFNPLVWLAARRLHVERELACDDQVLDAGTKASDYAGHLVEIARTFSAADDLSPAAVGMACSQLESRVRSILDPSARRRGLNRLSAGMISIGAVCLILSLAVVQPWGKPSASAQQRIIAESSAGEDGNQAQSMTEAPTSNAPSGEASNAAEREERQAEGARERETEQALVERDEQDGQTKAQSSELTANQIIELRSAGVTPEFIEAMRKQGFDNLTVRDLTQLSIHGINADYIRQARSWGGDKLTVREIVQLKISGVRPEYISAMKQAGYEGLTARQLSELSMHGVTPEYIAMLRRAGYDKLSARELTSLKIHGVDEAFIKEMQSWTGGKPSINELTALKIHGVTPEFANRMKAAGYENLPVSKLTQLRIHGIDEKYIKEMRDLGFDKLTIDQLLKMRIHGVDAEYVKKLRAAGLKNVSVNQMIEMKISGVDEILLKAKR